MTLCLEERRKGELRTAAVAAAQGFNAGKDFETWVKGLMPPRHPDAEDDV